MKELSIEEKAKAYDKAVEIINDYYQKIKYSSLSCASNDREVLEKAFPQIKESEDEKMLNQLHSWMKEFGGAEEYTEKVYCWLKGLLEKQKKEEPSIADIVDEHFWEMLGNEKQGEQKPDDIQSIEKRAYEVFPDDDDENTPFYRQAFIDGAVDYIDCRYKKSSAWSEEEQAEKDLELTWKDVEKIVDLYDDVYCDFSIGGKGGKTNTEEYYQEVLKRFKERE